MVYFFLSFFVILVCISWYILSLPVFGRLPSGKRLERIRALPNYRAGAIQNLSYTPVKPDHVSYGMLIRAMLRKNPNRNPPVTLPHQRPDFSLSADDKLIWFGHSSYLLQVDQLRVLVDPVFSPSTSPFSFIGNKNYPGTDFVDAGDLPEIDILLITHDHYDHLDYPTMLKLNPKVKHFLTSLGAGEHLRKWGIAEDRITELAWGEQAVLSGLTFTATPGRHFSGRMFRRNQTLWSSFVLQTSAYRLFLGGDSGYDTHFKSIGEAYGPFELAIVECGQYNAYWHHIHLFPEETVKVAKELSAKVLLPVHWGKFTLALHDWDDPILRVTACAAKEEQTLTTPMMGETVLIGKHYPDGKWWQKAVALKQ